MKLIPIAEATEAQLRKFAQETLGIEIKPTMGFDKVLVAVQSAWDRDIPVMEEDPEGVLAGDQPVPVRDRHLPPPAGKVRINIGIQEEAGGERPVEVGVNGKIMLIPRGKDVDIPEAYLEVLQHAVTYKYDNLDDGMGINPKAREVQLYPFQIRGRVDQLAAA
jgi:hypothetical protein